VEALPDLKEYYRRRGRVISILVVQQDAFEYHVLISLKFCEV
jgi:hypothetical protein